VRSASRIASITASKGQASASSPAWCAYSRAAARTGTSSIPSHGSTRILAPLHDGYGPRRKQNAGRRRILPRQTSRPTPKGTSLATGRLLLRPRQHNAGAPWPNLSTPRTTRLIRAFLLSDRNRSTVEATPIQNLID
jgi:hypothetical protein